MRWRDAIYACNHLNTANFGGYNTMMEANVHGIRSVAIIVGPYENASTLETSGFDFAAQADFRLGENLRFSSNIEATRIDHDGKSAAWVEKWSGHSGHPSSMFGTVSENFGGSPAGRWPANVVLDEKAARELDQVSGFLRPGERPATNGITSEMGWSGGWKGASPEERHVMDSGGGASRYFYVAKAPKKERPSYVNAESQKISHATVKPLALMRWLLRLATPPGGTVLDPFAGSGTTLEAAILEGFDAIGIEREAKYLPLIQIRIDRARALFGDPA